MQSREHTPALEASLSAALDPAVSTSVTPHSSVISNVNASNAFDVTINSSVVGDPVGVESNTSSGKHSSTEGAVNIMATDDTVPTDAVSYSAVTNTSVPSQAQCDH